MDLNKIYLVYVKWRACPIGPADPKDTDAFCTKYQITKQQILDFINKDSYQDDLLITSLNWAKSKTPELIHLVYNEVKLNKSVADLERFIQIAHEIKKKDKENKTVNNFNFFKGIDDQQYRNIIAREARVIDSGR